MAKKITIAGAAPRKIKIIDTPKRRLDPKAVAIDLGAEERSHDRNVALDPIALAEFGSVLSDRLRSTGGRPALVDADKICRVPLSASDIKILETMVSQLQNSTAVNPSIGQLVSVIVRMHLERAELQCTPSGPSTALGSNADSICAAAKVISQRFNTGQFPGRPAALNWLHEWSGKHGAYRRVQQIVTTAHTTWGGKSAA